jgi:hypothetical protein
VVGPSEHGNKHSGSIKSEELLGELIDYKLLQNYAAWSYLIASSFLTQDS